MDEKQITKKEDYIFGLDIGASKINLFVGISGGESITVVECGDLPLSDPDELDAVVETLQKAVKQLETTAGVDVHDVYVGIAGKHVVSFRYKGIITLPHHVVRSEDIKEVQRQASTLPASAGTLIHSFPCEYSLDDEEHIRNPKGRTGTRLAVDVQLVASRQNALETLAKCVNDAGLKVSGFVLEPLAAAHAVLTEDEQELGVALVDIGAGSADIAVFVNNSVRYTASLDLAGNVITSDISQCLGTPISLKTAEEIKKKYGTCMISNLIEDETFSVKAVGDRGDVLCSRLRLAKVITARVKEIFTILNDDLKKHQMDSVINGGIVLTGGCCNLEGIETVAKKVFGKSVRIGHPKGTNGIQGAFQNPSYATGIGLLYYANKELRDEKSRNNKKTGPQIAMNAKKGLQRIKEFIQAYF